MSESVNLLIIDTARQENYAAPYAAVSHMLSGLRMDIFVLTACSTLKLYKQIPFSNDNS